MKSNIKYVLSALFLAAINFLYNYILATRLSVDVYAKYSIFTASVFIFYGLTIDWIRLSMLKVCVLNYSLMKTYISTIYVFFTSVLLVILLVTYLFFEKNIFFIMLAAMACLSLITYEVFLAKFRVKDDFNRYSDLQLMRGVSVLVVVFIVYSYGNNELATYCILFSAPFLVSLYYFRVDSKSLSISFKSLFDILSNSFPLFLFSVMSFLLFYIDRYAVIFSGDKYLLAEHTFSSELVRQFVIFPLMLLNARFFTSHVKKESIALFFNYRKNNTYFNLLLFCIVFSCLLSLFFLDFISFLNLNFLSDNYISYYKVNSYKYFFYYIIVGGVLFFLNPFVQIFKGVGFARLYGMFFVSSYTSSSFIIVDNFLSIHSIPTLLGFSLLFSVMFSYITTEKLMSKKSVGNNG